MRPAVLPLIGWFVIGIANILAAEKLKRYRIDIRQIDSPYSGNHWSWQANVLRPRNYTSEGRRKLRWIYFGIAAQLACLLAAITLTATA